MSTSFRARVIAFATDLAQRHIVEGSAAQRVITEGRADWKDSAGTSHRYAWCGDFVTYVLEQCGAAPPYCLNRVSTNGRFAPGMTFKMLIECARSSGHLYEGRQAYARLMLGKPGDILILAVGQSGHICFLQRLVNEKTFVTADGNTGPSHATGINMRNVMSSPVVYAIDVDAFRGSDVSVMDEPTMRVPPFDDGRGRAGAPMPPPGTAMTPAELADFREFVLLAEALWPDGDQPGSPLKPAFVEHPCDEQLFDDQFPTRSY